MRRSRAPEDNDTVHLCGEAIHSETETRQNHRVQHSERAEPCEAATPETSFESEGVLPRSTIEKRVSHILGAAPCWITQKTRTNLCDGKGMRRATATSRMSR